MTSRPYQEKRLIRFSLACLAVLGGCSCVAKAKNPSTLGEESTTPPPLSHPVSPALTEQEAEQRRQQASAFLMRAVFGETRQGHAAPFEETPIVEQPRSPR
ncbi:MAG: hypothetical protein ACK5TR_04810 [Alphaproteobacteria bacterium]|jgi:hypothetical protein|nr:hypothetical protein [Alphaproteobacteria bacterium]